MAAIGIALAAAASAVAGEFAVLTTGFRIQAERHETDGAVVRLYSKDGGITQLPASQIASFESDDSVKAAAPAPTPAAAGPMDTKALIDRAAKRWGLPPELVQLVAKAESALKTDAVSAKGAIGVMQLMPDTARQLGADPHNVEQNIDAGARYLRELLLKYGHSLPKAAAAYNAGPGAVDRYNGIPPYRETIAYVLRLVREYQKQKP